MTGLNRTDLPTSRKVQLAASAVAGQAEYGAITDLAYEFEVSRPTVYAAGQTAAEVLYQHFEESQNGELTVKVDERQLERAIASLRIVAPNSIRAIETLLPDLYPGMRVSYGKIQQKLIELEGRAAAYNARAELNGIEAGALDEMYSQGAPVLAGVDLDSGFLFSLSLRESRSGQDWVEVLREAKERGLDLELVVKDAALGIAAGVSEVFPNAEQRDDCFHAFYEMGKLKRQLEQRAYGAITREGEAEKKLYDMRRTGRGNRFKLHGALRKARKSCKERIELHDAFEKAMREVMDAMEFVDLRTGSIRTASEMESSIKESAKKMMKLNYERCATVGRYIYNRAPGLALYMNDLSVALGELMTRYGNVPVRLASIIYRLTEDLERGKRPWARYYDERHRLGSLAMLHDVAGEKTSEILDAIDRLMQKRHRASSAIEGFNAALRPFLYVHKGVTDGFLELFRAYYNLRTRRWGRHKGTSAHEVLTGEPVTDWLSVLGYPPSTTVN